MDRAAAGGTVMPIRIQRKRTKGWRAPEGTVVCTRGTRWGNPFRIGDPWPTDVVGRRHVYGAGKWREHNAGYQPPEMDRVDVVDAYQQWMDGLPAPERRALLEPLRRAAYLACWCPTGAVLENGLWASVPCHVDVIRGWLESTRRPPAPGERIEMGVHAMPGTEAEGAPAWPSLGSVESRRQSAFRSFVRGAR